MSSTPPAGRLARLALLIAVAAGSAQAQETSIAFTALPVLEIPAVPELGGATVGRPADDARAFLQNPAALGLAPTGVRVVGSPNATWFGESQFGTTAAAWSRAVGPVSAAVGLAQGAMSADARTLADGTAFDPTDRYRALGGSVGTTGAVRVAAGATVRYITSTDAPVSDGARFTVGRLRGVTADVGVLAAADLARLAGRPRVGAFAPALDVSVGYAQTHVGGRIRYSGFGQQALPRTGALGWSVRAGLDVYVAGRTLRLVEAEGAFQAERRLVGRTGADYAALTGGASLADALSGTGGDVTTGRRGVGLTLAETVSLSWGRTDGGGYRDVATRSVQIRTGALVSAVASHLGADRLAGALTRTDLRIGRTVVFAGTPDAAARTTLSLVVRR